ncbi:MAG: helix-turn-helix domain-containing protein [Lachnospiraceae bacterium]|nr:helix-turn-helix domain-containing protein [Lachnospiraceae bacterium]
MKIHSTLVRYFLSYFLILILSLTSFITFIRVQIHRSYTEQQYKEVENRLNILEDCFIANINSILQSHQLLRTDMTLFNYRHEPTMQNRLELRQLFSYFDSNSDFIDSIVYINRSNGTLLCSNHLLQYKDNNTVLIYNKNDRFDSLDLNRTEIAEKNALLLLSGTNSAYLLYFPNDTNADYMLFYMINLAELQQIFKDNMINGIVSYALINNATSQIYGRNTSNIEVVTDTIPSKTGIYSCKDDYSLWVRANVYGDYSLVALTSDQYFASQINESFRMAYLLLFAISLGGLLLIFVSMKMTYSPLARLAQKVIPQTEQSKGYIEQLDEAFSAAATEKQQLQEKIAKYHLSIQKSLLDSGIDHHSKPGLNSIKNIDQIFRIDCENCIYMLRISYQNRQSPNANIPQHLESLLPRGSAAITLESGADYAVYLVNYIGPEQDKDAVIYSLMSDLHKDSGCLCAISNSGSSLTDIPTLYENALLASNLWPREPVVSYSGTNDIPFDKDSSIYPYKLLDQLSDSLSGSDFAEAQGLLKQMLAQLDQLLSLSSGYPDFIVRCLLIDILMTLFSSMNRHDIKFKLYEDLYFETLYYCRSCNWQEKKQEITENLQQMLTLFQTEQHAIRNTQIQEYLEQNYASEELTITTLADHFHVSIAYMSYLFKKKFGENFIDYLWKLRFEKASDMLLNTDLPVNTISVLVGYVNPSSFRRKFKQETGMSPSDFRVQ